MDTRRRPILAALALAFLASQRPALAQTPGWRFPGEVPATSSSDVGGLSADGHVAAGRVLRDVGGLSPFVWSEAAGRYDLHPSEPVISRLAHPAAVSSNGSAMTGFEGGREAFFWSGPGTYQRLGYLSVAGQPPHNRSSGRGISGDGTIVVGESHADQTAFGQAWRWTQSGGMQGLGFTREGHIYSEANGISRDGNVIVGMSQSGSGATDAFAWTQAAGMRILPLLPGATSGWAFAANHNASMIVGLSGGIGVLWSGSTVQALNNPIGWTCWGATDLSDDGSVILGTLANATISTPAIWTPASGWQLPADYFAGQGFALQPGWSVGEVTCISADGRTFGGSLYINGGLAQAFVLTVPAPHTVALLGTAAVVFTRRRRE
jgi:probable HAF family extracellular repeat protein